jgi:hypothetical protein
MRDAAMGNLLLELSFDVGGYSDRPNVRQNRSSNVNGLATDVLFAFMGTGF